MRSRLLAERLLAVEAEQRSGRAVPTPDRSHPVGENDGVAGLIENVLGKICLTVRGVASQFRCADHPSGGAVAARQHGPIDDEKRGEGKQPRRRRDIHQRQGDSGKEGHRDAGEERGDEADIGELRSP